MHMSMASGRSLDAERARQILATGEFWMAVRIERDLPVGVVILTVRWLVAQ